jgi:methionyl-tRNA formyltransferase
VRILLFHNWSSLGSAVARALMAEERDDLVLIGAATDHPEISLLEDAARRGVRCAVASDVQSGEFARDVAQLKGDVAIVATFPTRLPLAVMDPLRLGSYNVHPSLLPAYRGPRPEFWVIRNGEPVTGVTVHRIVERFDAGAIVAQTTVAIDSRETIGTLDYKLAAAGASLVRDVVARLRSEGQLAGRAQDEASVTRAPMLRDRDLQLRWEDDARSIDRLVRACDPWFSAVATLAGHEVVVRRVRLASQPPSLEPGELRFDADQGSLLCGTGSGALFLEAVDFDGETITAWELAERLGRGG